MKIMRSLLAVVITLSLLTGFGGVQMKKTVFVEAKDKKIKVKAASDFTLKLPANWKNNYVMKKSKKIKHGSCVSFYSKKCYRQTKEGWLFTIMRYKDDSYTDMPSYELVGKWNGYSYVALFPTDVQTEGAAKAAKKQYIKLNLGSLEAAASIRPVKKKKGKSVYCAGDFSLKIPKSWKKNYIVERSKKKKNGSYVAFYSKKCHKQTKAGWLFSIGRYTDESYKELPSYELAGKWNGVNYVAVFPTDVQFEGASKAAAQQYQKLSKSVEKVARSIMP